MSPSANRYAILSATAAAAFLATGFLAYSQTPFWPVPAAVMVMAAMAATQLRCPRCGLSWTAAKADGISKSLKPHAAHCPRCGRDRRDLKPFQYWFARDRSPPEPEHVERR